MSKGNDNLFSHNDFVHVPQTVFSV